MHYISSCIVTFVSGKGGNGIIAFTREKYNPNGGPAGGNGGRGGNIYLVADYNLNTLSNLSNKKIIKANNGNDGQKNHKHGKNANDLYFKVPINTWIYEIKENNKKKIEEKLIKVFLKDKETFCIVSGGIGGRGNASFKSSKNQSPYLCENGDLVKIKKVILKIKLAANIGLIGKPNAGKSTLLNALTNSKSIVNSYPFTTIFPVVGILKDTESKISILDIPGLIKYSYLNKGLGFQFLQHIENCQVLFIILSAENKKKILKDYHELKINLKNFNIELIKKPIIVLINKVDLLTKEEKYQLKYDLFFKFIFISGLYKINLNRILKIIQKLITKQNEDQIIHNIKKKIYISLKKDDPIRIIKINNQFVITGGKLKWLINKIPLISHENKEYLFSYLKNWKIFDLLLEKNIKENDEINIYNFVFKFNNKFL